MEKYLGENTPKLGFGLMRLPKLESGEIDVEQVKEMVDLFMDAGLTYFDTAYVYDGGKSEEAAKAALVERYPREKFTLATKLNARVATTVEEARQQLYTSLERTGAGYFDYYLLHAIGKGNIGKYDEYQIWDFVKEEKEKGHIKHWGFSFHDSPELLEELLTKHPDVEFVQLQINYADWESPSVASRGCYEVARKHNKPVVIMEPVKGGTLANPPRQIREILEKAAPEASLASWAVRYAASLEGILTVLSGMSNLEQMKDNISYMKDFKPLSDGERKVIAQVQEVLAGIDSIPCTSCRYCTDGCPMKINIPGIFGARNKQLMFEEMEEGKKSYLFQTKEGGKASDCIGCGQCEAACPQQINIIERLADCVKALEE